VTAYSSTTLYAYGETTTYQPTTVATETSIFYETTTRTSTMYQTVSGVHTYTSPIYVTVTATTTTTSPISLWGGMIPGFPIAAIVAGLVIGAMALIIAHRARKPRWRG